MSPSNNAIFENLIEFSNYLFSIFSMENEGYKDLFFLVRSFLSPLRCPSLPWWLAFAVRRLFSCVCFFPHHSPFPIIFVASVFSTSVCLLDFPPPCLDLPACFRTDILVLTCACFRKPVSLFVAASAASGTLYNWKHCLDSHFYSKSCCRHNNSTVLEYIFK